MHTGVVPGQTAVASANVLRDLGPAEARTTLAAVLELSPDLVALQEWGPSRRRLLRETGRVWLLTIFGIRFPQPASGPDVGYVWVSPLVGGCVVGARADRFELIACRSRLLGRLARADRGIRKWSIVPPRFATVGIYHDRQRDRIVSLVSFHLTPAVQRGTRYRVDRPLLVRAHRKEVADLNRIVAEQLALGRAVYAAGDSNFDGLRLAGLTSGWEGRESEPGTLGPRRKVDDVHGPGCCTCVRVLSTLSDHKAVLMTREGGP
jgi:hypothetical protein